MTITDGDLEVAAPSPLSGGRLDVHAPLVAAAWSWRLAGFLISDRNRFADLVGPPVNPWRYRNRISIEHPLEGQGPLPTPFASEEVFYDFGDRRSERSRAQAGFKIAASRHVDVQIYYLRQDDRASAPGTVNALGMTLAIALN